MSILSKSSIEAIMLLQSLLNNNSIFITKNDKKNYVLEDISSFKDKLTVEYLSDFYISNEGTSNEILGSFFEQNNNKDIALPSVFQFAAMFQLLKAGSDGNEENIQELELNLMSEISLCFDNLTFSELSEFSFSDEEILLFNSKLDSVTEMIAVQNKIKDNPDVKNILSPLLNSLLSDNKNRNLSIVIAEDKGAYEFIIMSLSEGSFVIYNDSKEPYEANNMQALLLTLNTLIEFGGMIFVREFTGEVTNNTPNYKLYAYDIVDGEVLAVSKDILKGNLSDEFLKTEKSVEYINPPFEV